MPLIFEDSTVPEAILRAMVKEFQEGLEEILASIGERGAPKDPLGVVTTTDLLQATIRLGRAAEGAPMVMTAALVNLQYATLLASVDLVKTHFDLPRVPRGPPPPA